LFIGKEYFPIGQIEQVLSKIQKFEDKDEPSGVRYLYQHGIRYNDNEGLIFTSEDKCYKPDICISIKKWKFQKLNTTDFLVNVSHHHNGTPSFLFYVKAKNGFVPYREVYLNSQCATRLLNDLNGKTEAIIECYYDNLIYGEWRYYRISLDKRIPNDIVSILQQLEVIIENISQQELIEAFRGIKPSTKIRYSPSKLSQKKYYEEKKTTSNQSSISPNQKDDIVYESPLKTEEESNRLKRKRNELNELNDDSSPDIETITLKKARLNPSPSPTYTHITTNFL